MLSIRMIKLCGNSIWLNLTFHDFLNMGKFPHEWKKANVVLVHNKGNKQSLKNYRPISLHPICTKIFERLTFNKMFTFFLRTIWSLQINQDLGLGTLMLTNYLLLPTKFKSFDEEFEVRGIFLDMSETFDKVWHESLLLKLNQNGISGNLFKLLRNFYRRSCTGFYLTALIISYLHKWFIKLSFLKL